MSVTNWVAGRLAENSDFEIKGQSENFLRVSWGGKYEFTVAVLGKKGIIALADVEPLFAAGVKPQFVVNVPSNTLWSGDAIDRIHLEGAAFGPLGDIARAARTEDAGAFRSKGIGFFIKAMGQHTNVVSVSYVYDSVLKVDRKTGTSLVVAVIETYNMSAEDVRNARDRVGHFDIVVKGSNHGSITDQAEEAAKYIGAQALTFRELMGRLGN